HLPLCGRTAGRADVDKGNLRPAADKHQSPFENLAVSPLFVEYAPVGTGAFAPAGVVGTEPVIIVTGIKLDYAEVSLGYGQVQGKGLGNGDGLVARRRKSELKPGVRFGYN